MFAAVFGRQDPQFTKPFNKQCIFEADVVMVRSQLNTVSFYAHMIKNQFGLLSTTSISFSSRNDEIKKERILKKILY